MRILVRKSATPVLVVAFFLVAPFTWIYLSAVSGLLVRLVDVVGLLIIALSLSTARIPRFPVTVAVALGGLVVLLLLRSIIYSESAAAVSAIKISYLLVSTMFVAGSIRKVGPAEINRVVNITAVLLLPFFAFFLFQLASTFWDIIQSPSTVSISIKLFSFWHKIFSENFLGAESLIEAKGVAFRNSAGVAFFIGFLFLYGIREQWGALAIIFFILATILFSRSVWALQLIFILSVALSKGVSGRAVIVAFTIAVITALYSMPQIWQVVAERVVSASGRDDMIRLAFNEFNSALLLGRPEGAALELQNGAIKPVHNVPLAFGLKTGLLGFMLAMGIAIYFGLAAFRGAFSLTRASPKVRHANLIRTLAATTLFLRLMVSASHEIFFSIGEWGALALYFAFLPKANSAPNVNVRG